MPVLAGLKLQQIIMCGNLSFLKNNSEISQLAQVTCLALSHENLDECYSSSKNKAKNGKTCLSCLGKKYQSLLFLLELLHFRIWRRLQIELFSAAPHYASNCEGSLNLHRMRVWLIWPTFLCVGKLLLTASCIIGVRRGQQIKKKINIPEPHFKIVKYSQFFFLTTMSQHL